MPKRGHDAHEDARTSPTMTSANQVTDADGPQARRHGGAADVLPDEYDLPERFRVSRIVGRGGMGVVLEVHDRVLDRDVAVKLLPREGRGDHQLRTRFMREARAAGALDHPGIVTVHDVDAAAGFIVMELIKGESLAERLKREKRLPVEEVRRIGRALLDALAAAHDAAIVHRDVKPANILIDEAGAVKLVDFGIASFGDSDLTSTGSRIGTPAYMAPEQLRGRIADPRADLYAVGATLFEAATGTKLHRAEGTVSDPDAVVLEATRDGVLADAIARAVRERPGDRFANARAFRDALSPTHALPSPGNARQRIVRRFVVAGVVAVIAGVALWRTQSEHRLIRANAELTELAAARRAPVIAVLPFDDRSGDAQLDFASSGLPHMLDEELSRIPDLVVLGHYRLRERVGGVNAARDEWLRAARAAGVDLVVLGELASGRRGVVLTVRIERLDTRTLLARFERDVELADVASSLRSLAGDLATTAIGKPVDPSPSTSRRLGVERDLELGIAALESHDLVAAERHVRAALAADPSLAVAHYYLAMLTWWNDASAGSVRGEIDLALDGDLDAPRRGVLEGLKQFINAEFVAAITHFQSLERRHPTNLDVLYGLSEALFHGGRPAEAAATYRRLRELSPRFRLGLMHPLQFYMAHGDEAGVAWAFAQLETASDVERRMWDARALLAQRDYPRAIDVMQRIVEDAPSGNLVASYAKQELLGAYAAAGRPAVALSLAKQSGDPQSTLGLYLALGAPAEQRAAHARAVRQAANVIAGNPRVSVWTSLAVLELAVGDAAALREIRSGLQAATEPHLANGLAVMAARALIAAALGDAAAIDDARKSMFPEVAAIARGLESERGGDSSGAARAWRAAIEADGDGRLLVLESYYLARVLRAAGDHAGAIDACRDVIEPRVFHWAWGAAVGPCLRWTAEAQAALGRPSDARATYRRLLALRAMAQKDDELVRSAVSGIAALAAP